MSKNYTAYSRFASMITKIILLILYILSTCTIYAFKPKNYNVPLKPTMKPILRMSNVESSPFEKWICPSCGFIFDEALGFKKKISSGH